MSFLQTDLVSLIFHLLPGFLAAWIYFSLTAHRRPAPFEQVVQALIFTTIIQAFSILIEITANAVGTHWFSIGEWIENGSFVTSVFVALVVGLLFAFTANHGWFHDFLQLCRITKNTSHPSEWFSAFNRNPGYAYLHFKDERRLYGWIEEWPNQPDSGHFIVMKPEWVLIDNQRAELCLAKRILVPASMVEMIEFQIDSPEDAAESEAHQNSVDLLVGLHDNPDDETANEEGELNE